MIYFVGFWVSELVVINLFDLLFDEGFVKVCGKGKCECFVFLGLYVCKVINCWFDVCEELVLELDEGVFLVFVN